MLNKSFAPLNFPNLKKYEGLNLKGLIAFLFLFALLIPRTNSVVPSQPIVVSPNTESSPSNFILNFKLQKPLQTTGYLLITFSSLTSTATPKTCLVINSLTGLTIPNCQNLDTGSGLGTLSVNTTWINQINPNIVATKTIAIQFNQALVAATQYSLQIITDNVLPAIGSITSNFQLYTISGTGFMLQENWNFGQVYFQYRQNNILNVNSINDLTQNYPGTLTSNLQFQITIAVQCPTPTSILKFIISGKFQFSASSLVNVQGILSTAPQITSTTIISPNIIVTKFNEAFTVGRKFKITITDIKNPLQIATGFVSVYYLPDNSMSPLQIKELAIPIATVKYTPTIEVLTGEGFAAFSPMQFYQQKQQYLTVTVILPRQCDTNFIIQISTDTLTIHQGTVFAKASTVIASKLTYNHYSTNGVQISGFPVIASGSKLTITMKVWIPTIPSFNVYASIDQLSKLANPIIQGAASTVDTVVATEFVTGFTGNEGQTNKLSSMASAVATPYSRMLFTVTPSFTTEAGSSLKLYTCQNLIKAASWSDSTSCLVGGVTSTCTLVTNDTVTLITINSGSSSNLFVGYVGTNIQIKDLQFKYLSSNTQYIYQFYFQVTASESSTNPIIKKTVLTPQVIPQRPASAVVDTSFRNYFSNDLYNTGANYPNMFRIISTTPAKWSFTIQSNQRRMITVFHKEKWTKLFTTLVSGDSYPFLSSITDVTSVFTKGTTSNTSIDCPLNWDQISFILPGTESLSAFSISFPMTYMIDTQFNFQLMAGIYNVQTRTITYRAIEVKPTAGSRTYKLFGATVPVSAKPLQSGTAIQLKGRAGSYKSNISVTVSPSATATFSGTTYSTALIITSTWNWFDSLTSIDSANISNADPTYPTFTNDLQKPLSLKLSSTSYLTFIPFKTTGAHPSSFSVYFNNVKLPYSHDLPYYSMLLVDQTGTIDSYNQFINKDKGVFYQTYLKKITFSCSDNSLGVNNTDCSINFITNNQIDIGSKILVILTGLKVSTDKCILTKLSDSSTISNICSSNTDKNQLIVTLQNTNRLADSTQYVLQMYGMSIDTNTIIHHIDMNITDSSGGYTIQYGRRILVTSVSTEFPILIEQMTYLKNNPIVLSGFNIIFTLPRKLNKDQVFAIVMGNDLSNLNSVPSKLKIRLYLHATNVEILNVRWFLNTKNYQIIFEGLYNILNALQYRIQIYGMKTPSTIDQNIISLIYLRTFDNSYTVQNTDQSTSIYPGLVDKVNSLITLKPYFNTEGIQQPLQFNITGQYAKVDANTVWYVSLPRYYSQLIWNQDYLIYCTINSTKLDCARHDNIPYTLIIKNSPRVIDIGFWYTIEIHGITCPRALYLNSNPTYVTQSIFMGIAANQTAESYIEYSELFMTEAVINPQVTVGYGTITVKGISSSNNQTFQTTFFAISLLCTVSIATNDYIFLTFPEGFDNFNDIDMEGQFVLGALRKTFTATVINTKVGFSVPVGISISANSLFSIQISSLPTPKTAITVDMNKLIVTLTPSTQVTTKASSLQLHNQVSTITFQTTQLHLVINNYQTILLTAGTYSNAIKIQPSDLNPYLSNIKVQLISSSLTFEPNPVSLYLGNAKGEFRLGAPQTLIPTLYTFQIIKSETSISAFYTALSKYSVLVSNNPISITMPATVTMPKGGCSIPFKISLSTPPFSDLSMSFEYDSNVFTLDQFWINEEISYNQLYFTKSISQRWVSFCCASNFTALSVPVSVYLGGTNEQAFTLSTNNFVVNVVSNATTIPQPTLGLVVVNTQKTYAKLVATVNLNGYIFYQLKLSPLDSPLSLLDLKYEIKQKNLTLQNQNDYLTNQIYTKDRDYRINFMPVSAGANNIPFQNLLAQRQYTFCAYFQNQHRVTTSRVCQTFTMQTWGLIKKITIKYKYTIFQNQLNSILCYFSKASSAKITQIVTLQGKSCSLNNTASNYFFNYNGNLQTNELSSTIIYYIADQNLTTDPSSSAFSGLYDATGISVTSLATALANFSIDYISSSYMLGSYNPIDMIKINLDSFKPTLTYTSEVYIKGSYSLYLRNLKLSMSGSVYLILTPYKKMKKDQIAGHSDIEIRPLIVPSYQQILNCLDGYNIAALACKRIVLKQNQLMDVQFSDVSQNRMYAVFYLIANQYPIRPIPYGSVQKQQMVTVVLFDINISKVLVFLLLTTISLIF